MKTFLLIFSISLIFYYVQAFEYPEYNTEDDGRSLEDYYKKLGEESSSYYQPVLTPINTPSYDNGVLNDIPNEGNVKPSDDFVSAPETLEVTVAAKQDSKKPYYDEKDAPELFQKFIKDFNKQYKDEEEYNKRYQNFVKNLKDINQLNKEQDATFDINMFADLGEGESVIG